MKQRIFSIAITLCLCVSSQSVAYAHQEVPGLGEDILMEEFTEGPSVRESTVPTPTEVYKAMIALREENAYKEGTTWTDYEPYSDSKGYYHWKGGPLDGKNISAVGCVAFAFTLSDAAFGSLPASMCDAGEFEFEDIKVGDILRMNTDAHTVIVLEVSDVGVVVAEGNNNGKVHWGRAISKNEVMEDTSHYITRYPEGYVSPDDPTANEIIGEGTWDSGLTWKLINAGTLTISGRGAMPDFDSTEEQPWSENRDRIRKVIIEDGVTSIGSCAFWNCGVLSAEISSSVTTIGNSAFRGSSIVAVNIPSGVKTIGDSAFRECRNLSTITFSEGLETIDQNAFRACTSLASVDFPASVGEVGDGAFFQCTAMKNVTFAPGSKQVKLGDNIFSSCYYLLGVTLPANIDRIGEGMFQNCGMLAGVEIPQGAESIGGSAFASSGVSVVIVPDSVTTIGVAAFSDCPLADIYFTGTETQWESIDKMGDTASAVSKATIHYNYIPEEKPGDTPEEKPGDTPEEKPGDTPEEKPGDIPEEKPGDIPEEKPSVRPSVKPGNNNSDNSDSSDSNSDDYSSDSSQESSSDDSTLKKAEDTLEDTVEFQWVMENTESAEDTSWRLKKEDGTYVTGTITVDADGNEKEQIAWAQVNDAWYAFGADGYADSGWVRDEAAGGWYFIDIDSGMQTGWHNDANDGATYFLDPVSGKMRTKWNLIEGKWYYFNEISSEPTWQRDELTGDWIYTGAGNLPVGAMLKGGVTPDGYIVDENGVWIGAEDETSADTTEWQWVAEDTESWRMKKEDGTYVAGMITVDADGNEKEQIAWARINGAWYAFGADGYADFGWVEDETSGSWYYIDINSGMQIGWNLIEGKWYYFNEITNALT